MSYEFIKETVHLDQILHYLKSSDNDYSRNEC